MQERKIPAGSSVTAAILSNDGASIYVYTDYELKNCLGRIDVQLKEFGSLEVHVEPNKNIPIKVELRVQELEGTVYNSEHFVLEYLPDEPTKLPTR